MYLDTDNRRHQSTHKTLHKQENSIFHSFFPPTVVSKPDPETGDFNPFPAFPYTGPLRPVYPLSAKRKVPASIPHPDYAADGIPKYGRLINRNKVEILDQKGIEGMRKVCRLAREVLDIAAAAVKPGVTTDEIDRIVHEECIKRDVSPVEKKYPWEKKKHSRQEMVACQPADCTLITSPTHRPSTTTTFPNPYAHPSTKSSATESPTATCSRMVIL